MLSCEAEAYAGFKQKWTLKLARSVSSIFADKTAAYRRRSNFEGFASYGTDSRYLVINNIFCFPWRTLSAPREKSVP